MCRENEMIASALEMESELCESPSQKGFPLTSSGFCLRRECHVAPKATLTSLAGLPTSENAGGAIVDTGGNGKEKVGSKKGEKKGWTKENRNRKS